MSEFDLIRRYFTRATPGATLGVGDDAALLRVGNGMELAVSTDMLVSGTHFLPEADPFLLGHKSLAVNLSDLAAMGAKPRWATLALSLPSADEAWLQQFSAGFFSLSAQHSVELVGGDTTRGPLNLCVTIMGEVPHDMALRRDGARVGDEIWVSGRVGNAALALAHLQGRMQLTPTQFSYCEPALHQPIPRVALGLALRGVAHSAIDISDGLLADLGHILERSKVGAEIHFDKLPIADWLSADSRQPSAQKSLLDESLVQRCILAGGDDYELCFTASVTQRSAIENISRQISLPLTPIGIIVDGNGCKVRAADGGIVNMGGSGYDHFR
jgi:thiamine-monophosphate kinase